jgi:hypothetical protein
VDEYASASYSILHPGNLSSIFLFVRETRALEETWRLVGLLFLPLLHAHNQSVATFLVQDSPVFSFINNLSPIEPLKSAYNASSIQGYQSINITSVSSIFTSPHDNAHKETRLAK